MDNLIKCPCCGSDACSKNPVSNLGEQVNSYLCWTCGFTTNELLRDGSDFEKENYELTAELIKDLKQVHENLSWYPKVINLQENVLKAFNMSPQELRFRGLNGKKYYLKYFEKTIIIKKLLNYI